MRTRPMRCRKRSRPARTFRLKPRPPKRRVHSTCPPTVRKTLSLTNPRLGNNRSSQPERSFGPRSKDRGLLFNRCPKIRRLSGRGTRMDRAEVISETNALPVPPVAPAVPASAPAVVAPGLPAPAPAASMPPLWRVVLALAVPALFEQIFNFLVGINDTWLANNLPKDVAPSATAAVGTI